MPVQMDPERFEDLVSEALDLIPPELAAAVDNVVVLVADRHPDDPELLGLYEGIALTERDSTYAGALPDTVTIFRESLLEICATEDEVVEEVAITVIHELAHHFGIDDQRLHELGWD
ncbi:metallopeptidase family protein [Mycolicibacterium sp.]|uniref:metallopeptidase family protein n=1 Tax=Mycolicibacterium sp. TaxID=2320850 RepID=UPI0028A667A2|nr:metallopeptidase family protein [Mycolicibacterium sp.]